MICSATQPKRDQLMKLARNSTMANMKKSKPNS